MNELFGAVWEESANPHLFLYVAETRAASANCANRLKCAYNAAMSLSAGKIEVVVEFPSSTKAVGKVLHALHLDRMGKAALDAHTLHTEIDEVASEGKLTESHVFPVEPGEHDVVIWTTGLRATRSMTERSARVRFEPGQKVVLRYLYKETSAELTSEQK